ncbi:uncharacterized protein Z518_09545 [Rhinocladiella mackenziei CBS 650.93]|uniref:Rhinocladiella mackenziei CBS 650.93 unplaced genomic scaffold supercont1.7, whole genome shotgun sequence n=1 Tax=Rhinocladiella mackenziei CBS 650.93 TaxID=1442369 RepID=A0A0D2GTZ4_9EURO|nr:uncharacterized protein Z518_09545 [Rhinocladiella mackenziei CBS 650.93]KIX01818.1 hypothetical protein Z518_09545 [Rhinocladiella mackenziei CBS 650.93]
MSQPRGTAASGAGAKAMLEDQSDINNDLQIAVQRGLLERYKNRIESTPSADVNTQFGPSAETALHIAARLSRLDIVKSLVEAGADLKLKDRQGYTAGHTACYWGHPEIVRYFFNDNKYYNVNDRTEDDMTCLHLAVSNGTDLLGYRDSDGTVEELLQSGAQPNDKNREGLTAWELANERNLVKVISVFALDARPEVYESTCIEEGEDDLHWDDADQLAVIAIFRRLMLMGKVSEKVFIQSLKLLRSNFLEDSGASPILNRREPSCHFDYIIATQKPNLPDFISLVIPYFFSGQKSYFSPKPPEDLKLREQNYTDLIDTLHLFGMDPSCGIHQQLSLDEYCVRGLEFDSLAIRNGEQTVIRYEDKKRGGKNKGAQEGRCVGTDVPPQRLITVGQAWFYQIDHFSITAYDSYERNTNQAKLNVLRTIVRKQFNTLSITISRLTKDHPRLAPSAYAGILLSECINLINHPAMAGFSEPVLNVFEKAINNVSEEVKTYSKSMDYHDFQVDKERDFLHEIGDIREELSMIKKVVWEQETVWKDFTDKAWGADGENWELTKQDREVEGAGDLRRLVERPRTQFRVFNTRVAGLEELAERVEASILTLLDLKSKHASMGEAHTTTLMSAAIFGFTIVTVVFTPLSFVIALFALPMNRFRRHQEAGYSTYYIGKWVGKSTAPGKFRDH